MTVIVKGWIGDCFFTTTKGLKFVHVTKMDIFHKVLWVLSCYELGISDINDRLRHDLKKINYAGIYYKALN